MSEPGVPRSRWRRAMVIVPLVILIAWGGTWWWFSRLNSVEKDLVGEWKIVNRSNNPQTVRFHSDRTAYISVPDEPTLKIQWFARGDQLSLVWPTVPFHVALEQWVRSGFRDWVPEREVHTIQVFGPDHVVVIDPTTGPGSTPEAELFRMESPP
jgi:hypothetical protein